MDSSWFKIKELTDSVFMIQEPLRILAPDYLTNTVNMFVIHDKNEALLIDCGTGVYSISDLMIGILGKRTIVTPFVTHNHWDHVGSLHEFESVLIHQNELEKLKEDEPLELIREDVIERHDEVESDLPKPFIRKKFTGESLHVQNGEWLQVGKQELQIVFLGGHTPGSIGLYYPNDKFVFVGDAFQTGYVFADENPKEYFRTLEKLEELYGNYYMSAHEEILLQKKDLDELRNLFSKWENKETENVPLKNRYLDNTLVRGTRFSIILPKNEINI